MRFSTPLLAFAAAATPFAPGALAAQAMIQPVPGTTDADRLADTMRRLVVSPTDLNALLDAGELSLRVDDLSGAASLFARADKVDPRNARVKAGMATILVRAERPGEALRYFAQAEALGLSPMRMGADRGLAYDLIGEQERAQRDYRLALRDGTDDELVRRYALSLGIAGRREQALAVLEPLTRRSDRGAWRARAFILAMTGDVPGASTIATTMMPGGMAQNLRPFFQRLGSLGAADRAFAVHFGEVRATPERLADARLAPALTPLVPEATPPVALAAAEPVRGDDRRRRDRREARAPVVLAALPVRAVPAPVALMPVRQAPVQASVQPVARPVPQTTVRAASPALATVSPVPPAQPAAKPVVQPVPAQPAPIAPGFASTARPAQPAQPVPTVLAATDPVAVAPAVVAPGFTTAVSRSEPAPFPAPAPVADVAPDVALAAAAEASAIVPSPAAAPAAIASAPVAAPPTTRPADDSVLARIVAGLPIPAAELGVPPLRSKPAASSGVAEARVKAAEDSADRRDAVTRLAAAAQPERAEAPVSRRRGAAEPVATEPQAAAPTRRSRTTVRAEEADAAPAHAPGRRSRGARPAEADDEAPATPVRGRAGRPAKVELADAAAGKRGHDVHDAVAATGRKATTDKPTARKAPAAEAARVWVQVATGANEADLPKAWERVKGKAPDAFKGRSGYATPLRATNRVVTGPFKSEDEAQAFVNGLAKKGLSASTFTSDAGQKVAKLPTSAK